LQISKAGDASKRRAIGIDLVFGGDSSRIGQVGLAIFTTSDGCGATPPITVWLTPLSPAGAATGQKLIKPQWHRISLGVIKQSLIDAHIQLPCQHRNQFISVIILCQHIKIRRILVVSSGQKCAISILHGHPMRSIGLKPVLRLLMLT
jgi:hypothetical protein